MLGVTFGNKHSYNDWGIWLEDTHINPPLPKRYIVDVPARNGLLDLTPELTPTIRFENRTLTFNFRVKAGDWSTLVSQIYGDIHGRTLDVVSDLDPNWHWHGCVTVDDFSSDERTGKLVITVDADPFKLSNTENSYTINGNGTITCEVDRMEISPAFEIEAPTTVIYGDSSYTIESTATTEKTLSGDIVSFADGTANPAVDLTVDIEAVQDLHGYDNPWVGGAGVNLWGGLTVEKMNTDGTFSPSTSDWHSPKINIGSQTKVTLKIYENSSYTSGSIGIDAFDSNGTRVQSTNFVNTGNISSYPYTTTLTFSGSPSYFYIRGYRSGGASTITSVKAQVEFGDTATDYQPYANICPISGWDVVNVFVRGINQWDEGWVLGTLNTSNGSAVAVSNRIRSKNYISVLPNTTYYIRAPYQLIVCQYTSDQSFIRTLWLNNGTLTTAANTAYIRIASNVEATTYNNDISINYPSTDHDYHAYNGQTYTTDLDGTRYGGTLDVTTGVLTVTHASKLISDLSNWGINTAGTHIRFYSGTLLSDAKRPSAQSVNANIMSDSYKAYSFSQLYGTGNANGGIALNTNGALNVTDANYSTANEFLTAKGSTRFVYELATPQVVQLTAEQVMILKNQNNIWADSGEVEVIYIAQDFAGRKFFIPDLELTEGSHSLTIQGTGTTKVTYTNGRL